MHLNLLSDKDEERSLFNAAGNGDVRPQEELGRRFASLYSARMTLKFPRHQVGRCLNSNLNMFRPIPQASP